MTILNVNSAAPSLAQSVNNKVQTGVDGLSPVRGEDQQYLNDWQGTIDKLDEWCLRPSFIDEDDLESPSVDAINSSYRLVEYIRELKQPVPDRVSEDGEGGIVLEKMTGDQTETFQIYADGSIEYMLFMDSRLAKREKIFDG